MGASVARPLPYWCQSRAIRAAGTEIHPAARIGPGLSLMHSVGIVIGNEVVAGGDLVLQGVTLGHGRSGSGQPTVAGPPTNTCRQVFAVLAQLVGGARLARASGLPDRPEHELQLSRNQ